MNHALCRDEIDLPLPEFAGSTVLVTGSGGFIGQRVCNLLRGIGADVLECEPPSADVLDPSTLPDADWCIHLAAHKYATTAEDNPAEVADLNVRGTQNVIEKYSPHVVLASTCKAADPCTVYGASKLIAERIAMNAGARVVRFVNVLGSSGSVAQLWGDVPEGQRLPVTPCYRMWMSDREAAALVVAAMDWPTGRYALDVPDPEAVVFMAKRLHPGRAVQYVRERRGDRIRERLVAEPEYTTPFAHGINQIHHPFDVAATNASLLAA